MSEKIVSIRPGVVMEDGRPDPEVVEILSHYLAEAQAGRLIACAVSGVTREGFSCFGHAAGGRISTLLGSMTRHMWTICKKGEE